MYGMRNLLLLFFSLHFSSTLCYGDVMMNELIWDWHDQHSTSYQCCSSGVAHLSLGLCEVHGQLLWTVPV